MLAGRALSLPRLLVAAGAGLVLLAGGVLAAAPAQAAACSGTTGVTVVVDFGSAGGGQLVGCAKGSPSSGLAALTMAGFSVTQVQTQPGFVCKISGKPSAGSCVKTPPATAYWSYWHAPRGGSWSYSQVGAGSYKPKPGSVEGWAFGSGGKPGISPPAKAAAPAPPAKPPAKPKPKPATTTHAPAPARTATTPGRAPTSPAGAAPRTPASAGLPTPGMTPGNTSSVTAGGAVPGTTATTDAPSPPTTQDVESAPVNAQGDAGGRSSSTGMLVGAGLVAALAAAGAVLVRRRRHPLG